MKKSEILRGRNFFKRIAHTGKRLEGHLLRCTYLVYDEGAASLQVAFKVPSRNLNAVRRNRLRRLMREAMTKERSLLDTPLAKSSVRVGMMMFYKGAKDVVVERITLAQIRKDVGMFCRAIASML
ncbi:MAG: ribonuclease P protein component [Bacteroidota bacterium]